MKIFAFTLDQPRDKRLNAPLSMRALLAGCERRFENCCKIC